MKAKTKTLIQSKLNTKTGKLNSKRIMSRLKADSIVREMILYHNSNLLMMRS